MGVSELASARCHAGYQPLYLSRGDGLHPKVRRTSLKEGVSVIVTRVVPREHDHSGRGGQLHQRTQGT